ncbi:hypothetical protein [Frankia sp. QA3]|uniref:hypothetical protein n=1 Tax=Frankia sp. QA3 TaxID=710111 RepID=UPI000269C5E6|nr:hypothetical protein [Frankia sp. QA3]EIV93544.1 hypothetical protein FraQA3DRAFT_3249 [Frankia sp. QA3]
MVKRVLLVGLLPKLVDDFHKRLDRPDIELLSGTGVEEVRAAFAQADIEHVFLGGGLDLRARLEMIRVVFESSDKATVHLKDHLSGPEGFVPFVRAVLGGLDDYEPRESSRAVLRAQRRDLLTED